MEEKLQHFLYPANLFANHKPHIITTILGSCVSVCLWDPLLRLGGMNHYMLPLWNGEGLASPKYGNIAIQRLIEKMEAMGSVRSRMVAKIFGGAEVINSANNQFRIGERNVLMANEMLKDAGILIGGLSTGGNLGRKILYHTDTGEVMQRLINKSGG